VVALAATALLPATALAQPRLRFTAAMEAAQRYDDNLFPFSTSAAGGDFVSRMGPRLGAAYRGRSLGVTARYARDAEVFQRHRELNSTRARQDAEIDVQWTPARRLTLAAGASYAETNMARELNLITGLETGRLPAQRFSARDSVSLRLGRLTRIRAEHTFDRERTSGYPTMDSHLAGLTLERRFGPSDIASVGFSRREFATEGSAVRSNVLALGWSRQVTPRAHLEIKAGPRLSDGGRISPELSAALHARFRRGDFILAYTRTEATAVGHVGRLTVDGVSGTFRHQLLRRLWLGGGPGIFTSARNRSEATVYRADMEFGWQFARRLALTGSYAWSLQQGSLGEIERRDIRHNTFSLRLVAGSAGS
jgi:hypothetical protein